MYFVYIMDKKAKNQKNQFHLAIRTLYTTVKFQKKCEKHNPKHEKKEKTLLKY